MTRQLQIALWILAGVSIALTILVRPVAVGFRSLTLAEVVQLVTPLLLVALFIERALEVFLSALREPEAVKKTRKIQKLKANQSGSSKSASDKIEEARDDIARYRAETQRIAFVASFALGVVISAVGVRSLELFVDPAAFQNLSASQRTLFGGVDVVLTGAVLGGGSEGLHKLVTIFTNFMDRTRKNQKPVE